MSLKSIAKATKNEYAFMADEENNPYTIRGWVDTDCFMLNAILSDGDIFKGLPLGKRIMLGGKSSTAKSLFTMYILSKYLEKTPNSHAVIFESEGATVTDMMDVFKVDKSRCLILPVSTVEDFKTQFVNALKEIEDEKLKWKVKADRARSKGEEFTEPEPHYMTMVDSLGMLGTAKETDDALSGKQVQDMTRAKQLKSFFRLVTLKLSILDVPLIIVNHTYDTQEMYSREIFGGGEGGKYAMDIGLILTKAKMKEGTDQTGAIISFNTQKSRYMQENKKVKIILHFKKGVYRWSGLLETGIELGVIEKEGISYIFPDGQKARKDTIMKKPNDFWNEKNLQAVGQAVKANFGYIAADSDIDFDDMEVDDE